MNFLLNDDLLLSSSDTEEEDLLEINENLLLSSDKEGIDLLLPSPNLNLPRLDENYFISQTEGLSSLVSSPEEDEIDLLELSPTELEKLTLEIALGSEKTEVAANEPDMDLTDSKTPTESGQTIISAPEPSNKELKTKLTKGMACEPAYDNLVKGTAYEPAKPKNLRVS